MFTPFKLERYFAKHEFSTKYLLSSSDCESLSIRELLEYDPQAKEEFGKQWLGYTESLGEMELRTLIASHLYSAASAEHIMVHSGAQEAIYSFMKSVLEPGNHIVVVTPAYQSLYSVAEDRNIEVSKWALQERDGSWTLDVNELKKLVSNKTKAVILNVPNNPTGFLPTKEEFLTIVETCRKHGLYLFLDEVYRGLEFQENDRLPACIDVYEKGISLGVLSKTYGLAGLRIGWIATKCSEVFEKMAAYKDFLTICSSAPSEFLAKVAIKNHKNLSDRNRNIILNNLEIADNFFSQFSEIFDWKRPQAGPIAFTKLRSRDSDEFCESVRQAAECLLLPSTVYGSGNSHVRFGFGRKNFEAGIEKLTNYLNR